jgi:hypothetical protein
MQSEIPYLFDEVFALRAERKEDGSIGRGLLTQPTGAWVAKDRSGALDTWEPASIESIAGKISIATDGTGSTEAVEPTKGSTTEEGGTDAPSATDGALARHRSRYFALLGEVPLSEQGKKIVAESYREKTGVESRSEWSAEQYRQRADELAQRSADKRGDGLSERLEMLSKMTGAAPYKLVGGAE